MKNILVISTILPVAAIERKKKENDIQLETENQLLAYGKKLKFNYIFNVPRTTKFLGLLNKRWQEYNAIQNAKSFIVKERKVNVLGIIRLPVILSFRNVLFDVSYWLNKDYIAEIIYNTRPDIIHAQDADSSAYLARKIYEIYKIPYVVTLRDVHKVKDQIVQTNLNEAAKLVAISPTQVKDASSITRNKIDLVPHGIDAKFFIKEIVRPVGAILKFVVVTRLLPLKNIDKVINALAEIDIDFIFDIYGNGPEYKRLQEIIEAKKLKNKVFLKGWVANHCLPDILPEYDMFLMPSYPEALGRVYFEAMACGLPVLATKNTGIDGIISQGVEGFLVEPTQHCIDKVIFKITDNPAMLSEMKEAAFQTAKKYSWGIISKKYDEIYNSI